MSDLSADRPLPPRALAAKARHTPHRAARAPTTLTARLLKSIGRAQPPIQRIAVAERGNLGDVIACLPMAGLLKAAFPGVEVHFVARLYTRPLLDACRDVDGFVDAEAILLDPSLLEVHHFDTFLNPSPWRELGKVAWQAGIPRRIAHLRRGSNTFWCNRYVMGGPPGQSIHVAQRNLRDLRALGLRDNLKCGDLPDLMSVAPVSALRPELAARLCTRRFNLILHPKSNGHGREWPIDHYLALANLLPAERFNLLLTGCAEERQWIAQRCPALLEHPNVIDLIGRLELTDLIALVAAADGLLASGTGPVHLAAVLGIHALGLFPVQRGIDSVRWKPLGAKAEWLAAPRPCDANQCQSGTGGGSCGCMSLIRPDRVMERVMSWRKTAGCQTGVAFGDAQLSTDSIKRVA